MAKQIEEHRENAILEVGPVPLSAEMMELDSSSPTTTQEGSSSPPETEVDRPETPLDRESPPGLTARTQPGLGASAVPADALSASYGAPCGDAINVAGRGDRTAEVDGDDAAPRLALDQDDSPMPTGTLTAEQAARKEREAALWAELYARLGRTADVAPRNGPSAEFEFTDTRWMRFFGPDGRPIEARLVTCAPGRPPEVEVAVQRLPNGSRAMQGRTIPSL